MSTMAVEPGVSQNILTETEEARRVEEIALKIYSAQSLSEMTVEDIDYLKGRHMQPLRGWIMQNYKEYYNILKEPDNFESKFNQEIMLVNRRHAIEILARFIVSDSVRYLAFNSQFETKLIPYWTERYGEKGLKGEIKYLKQCFVTFWGGH